MLRLINQIRIYRQPDFSEQNALIYNFVNQIETEESWDGLTDTCTVTLPKKTSIKERDLISGSTPLFKRGDKIEVYTGYFPNIKKVFSGFINKVQINIPIVIECEDYMWQMKRAKVKKVSLNNTTLDNLLKTILPDGTKYKAIDTNIGDWRIQQDANVTNVLDELRSQHNIYSYFIGDTLYSGLAVYPEMQQTKEFFFEKNIIDYSNLEYQIKDDIRIKVDVKVHYSDNKNGKTYTFGDDDGDVRTLNLYNTPESEIKRSVESFLERVKYTGYVGSFETFGEPYVNSWDIAKLRSNVIPERNGNYQIKSIRRSFGINGYRQEIELEQYLGG